MEIVDLRRVRPLDQAGPRTRRLLGPALYPLSAVYGLLTALGRRIPGGGPDVGAPVVSVGSVLVGGTGKTPLCMLVADQLIRQGLKVCIISRGYMRRGKTSPLVVSDGTCVRTDVAEAGDEPYLMAKRLPGACVIVDKDRARAARLGRSRLRCDVFVLDDGFQTRTIHKHLEIVCVDAASLRSRQFLLPLGRLRESWRALRPEHIVVVVADRGEGLPNGDSLERLAAERFAAQRVLIAVRQATALVDARGWPVNREQLGERGLLALSGIARPAAFEAACERLGLAVTIGLRMDDHHWYNRGDTERVLGLMKQHGCAALITTEKDLHRLPEALRQIAVVMLERLEIERPEILTGILRRAAGMP